MFDEYKRGGQGLAVSKRGMSLQRFVASSS